MNIKIAALTLAIACDHGFADHCLTTWLMNQRAGSFTTSQLCGKKNKLIQ